MNLIRAAADRIETAAATRRAASPVRNLIGGTSIDAAYAVQQELIDRRVAGGEVIVGRKIGLTAPSVQQQLGVDQPDFGVLFASMDVSAEDLVPMRRLLQPRAEAEVAFTLNRDLTCEDLSEETIHAAVDYAVAALEIVDSRIENWDLTIADTVADNASSGLFVLGPRRLTLAEFEPRTTVMRLYADDELVSTGEGQACLGDPLNALVWLARTASAYGNPLRSGQVVLSGALGPMVPVTPGARIHAEIEPLGTVSATFSSEEDR
ncbi:2-keto-4-pentenoate hydratase (plasmid) [Mycolicibacterium frederiksbergense]|uniref:2-keto-4-pentenoate hydratase n=1 Tax=Mycolicibacterium frederiksbergense TaxID=117567 RepID=A0A6H0S004_9MYCO|nr:2-keto-4-pentenoate hydratase [Mycolicibacterium frederiksbergense]